MLVLRTFQQETVTEAQTEGVFNVLFLIPTKVRLLYISSATFLNSSKPFKVGENIVRVFP